MEHFMEHVRAQLHSKGVGNVVLLSVRGKRKWPVVNTLYFFAASQFLPGEGGGWIKKSRGLGAPCKPVALGAAHPPGSPPFLGSIFPRGLSPSDTGHTASLFGLFSFRPRSQSAPAALTKYHTDLGLRQQTLISCSSGGGRAERRP